MMTNWKTTAAGTAAILAGLTALAQLFAGELPSDEAWPLISAAVAAIAAGLGLTGAKDADKPDGPPSLP